MLSAGMVVYTCLGTAFLERSETGLPFLDRHREIVIDVDAQSQEWMCRVGSLQGWSKPKFGSDSSVVLVQEKANGRSRKLPWDAFRHIPLKVTKTVRDGAS